MRGDTLYYSASHEYETWIRRRAWCIVDQVHLAFVSQRKVLCDLPEFSPCKDRIEILVLANGSMSVVPIAWQFAEAAVVIIDRCWTLDKSILDIEAINGENAHGEDSVLERLLARALSALCVPPGADLAA